MRNSSLEAFDWPGAIGFQKSRSETGAITNLIYLPERRREGRRQWLSLWRRGFTPFPPLICYAFDTGE